LPNPGTGEDDPLPNPGTGEDDPLPDPGPGVDIDPDPNPDPIIDPDPEPNPNPYPYNPSYPPSYTPAPAASPLYPTVTIYNPYRTAGMTVSADGRSFTTKDGITSLFTVTSSGVKVTAGMNKGGTLNSESTAAAVFAAALTAKRSGFSSITLSLPQNAVGISKIAVQKIVKAASGTTIVLDLTSAADGQKVGSISLPLGSSSGQILTKIHFGTQRIKTVQNYVGRRFNTKVLGGFETAQKNGWGATATLTVSLDKLGIKADEDDILYALVYDTQTKKWYQTAAMVKGGSIVIKTAKTSIVTIVTDSIR
jgi:hypothetical protein